MFVSPEGGILQRGVAAALAEHARRTGANHLAGLM
jgi:hypothetical protein